jgi:hypothetical protein
MTMRKQYLLTTFGRPFGRNSRGGASLGGGCQAGAYDFLIRQHPHCLSPGVALTLLLIWPAGKMGWIQPFGIAWVALNGWKRIGRIAAIPGPLCDFMSALEMIRRN